MIVEKIPTTENSDELKNAAVEAFLQKLPDAVELYCRWIDTREKEIDAETDPAKRRLKQIELNIERGDIFLGSKQNDQAYDQYLDAKEQVVQELAISQTNAPDRIETDVLQELMEEIRKKLESL